MAPSVSEDGIGQGSKQAEKCLSALSPLLRVHISDSAQGE